MLGVCVPLVWWALAAGGSSENKQQMGERDELIVWVLKAISCWHCKQLEGSCFVMWKGFDGTIMKTGLSLHEMPKYT